MATNSAPVSPASLVVGLSSSSLFNTSESDAVFREKPLEDYVEHQVTREDIPFPKGTAFPLVETMMRLNGTRRPFEITVLSKNEPEAGNRVMRSLAHYGFENVRAAFTGGEPIAPYCAPLDVDLFLSREPLEVKRAMASGIPSGLLYPPPTDFETEPDQLRIAFDFDGVLVGLESELVYQKNKPDIEPYRAHEVANAKVPHKPGPFFPVLKKLYAIKIEMEAARRAMFPENEVPDAKALALALKVGGDVVDRVFQAGDPRKALFLASDEGRLESAGFSSTDAASIARKVRALLHPVEIAVVTARNPPVDQRCLTTLRNWGVRLDQMFLLGGKEKRPFLKQFRAQIFFDDQEAHTKKAHGTVPTGLVPWPEEAVAELERDRAAVPGTPTPTPIVAKVELVGTSEKVFEVQCRAIFKTYSVVLGLGSSRLDERFQTFLRENQKRTPIERTAILERLKPFALDSVSSSHDLQLNRDRGDQLLKRLSWISNVSAQQTEFELGATAESE